jgi:hypothetical protein
MEKLVGAVSREAAWTRQLTAALLQPNLTVARVALTLDSGRQNDSSATVVQGPESPHNNCGRTRVDPEMKQQQLWLQKGIQM